MTKGDFERLNDAYDHIQEQREMQLLELEQLSQDQQRADWEAMYECPIDPFELDTLLGGGYDS